MSAGNTGNTGQALLKALAERDELTQVCIDLMGHCDGWKKGGKLFRRARATLARLGAFTPSKESVDLDKAADWYDQQTGGHASANVAAAIAEAQAGPLERLLLADPSVAPAFQAVFVPRLSAVKREEIEADARGEDLWRARNPGAES